MLTDDGLLFSDMILEAIIKRLFPYEEKYVARLATVLDPRFKEDGFRKEENSNIALTLLENEILFVKSTVINEKGENEEEQRSIKLVQQNDCGKSMVNTPNTLLNFVAQRHEMKNKMLNFDTALIKKQYLDCKSHIDQDPLLFWKINGPQLKPLSCCAKKFLCVPASSVESERVFSKTGMIINDRRNRLKPETVDILVFLQNNLKIN